METIETEKITQEEEEEENEEGIKICNKVILS